MLETGLEGKICIVSGAASGIGRTTAEMLLAEGAIVVAVDLDGEKMSDLVATEGPPDSLLKAVTDVADPESVDELMRQIDSEYGRVDALVHSAGIYTINPMSEIGPEEWDRVLDINLRGSFLLSKAAMERMERNGDGRIVLLGSFAARTGGLRASAPYAASKGGVAGLMHNLAQHGGPKGIRVNCIHPGFVDTPMNIILNEEARADAIAGTPLRRLAQAEDLASMAVVLISDLSAYVTGHQLDVNGGMYMS